MSATPCGSIRRNSLNKVLAGGWLVSLEDEVKKIAGIELNVAYITNNNEEDFQYQGVHYFPICLKQSKNSIVRVLQRNLGDVYMENIVYAQLQRCVNIVKPDIIHVHGTEGMMGKCIDFIEDIPVVFSIQGLIAPYLEKYFSGIPQENALAYDKLFDIIRGVGIKNQWRSFEYRANRELSYLKNAKYVLGRTFWDSYCTLAINPERKYFVVNEILRSEFYSKQWKGFIGQDKIKLVSTISDGIYKGFETVLKAASLLKKYSNIDFEWHIAGYTQKTKWVRICEKYTNIYAKDHNIVFHGKMDADELSSLLCGCDIYIHVSHIENSPNSVCEAMLLGMPIIASYAGGTASLLDNMKEGILYQDGDPYVLVGSILCLRDNLKFAKALADAAYRRAIIRHDKSSIVNELIGSYKAILANFHNELCE